ncbi:lytic transglycosylase domain-containing protein [Agromyces silvae]|uniref:lytic transglycosylase domain-containing protein n=1 Tax=Agromyces silvae TaxID=3388266 RepID=UPI00280BBC84|nr:lytic murein transglycosylase [Agromyces protaetiae]
MDRDPAGFDDLLGAADDPLGEPVEQIPPPSRTPWVLAASVGSILIGTAAVVAATLTLPAGAGVPPGAEASASRSATAPPEPAGVPAPGTGWAAGAAARQVDPGWVADVAERTAIPGRALAAYAGAAHRVRLEHPGCGLGWNTLAGIGLVESEHGRIDGARIGGDGVVTPPIIGIPLDGTRSDAIPDTDRGALDGDAVWDRAVGPMQFIPSTWAQWASDGDGDGVADPHQIDDAAFTAARYLCHDGADLTDPQGWIAAIASYNSSLDYNHRVAEAATRYAENAGAFG